MELQQVQSARLSQRQLYSVELLRLSTAELDVRIRELAQENPVIDLEEAGPEPQETVPEEFVDRLRWLEDNDSQNWFYQQVSDAEMDPLARVGTDGGLEETLTGFLSRQLDRLSIERDTRRLVEYLIRCLDDDGYLRIPLEELSNRGEIPLKRLEEALALLRTLEPAGVGAGNLSQCLTFPLERVGETGPALAIVRDHIDLLARRHDRALARELGITPEQVELARRTIRELEPRPGAPFHHFEQTLYPQPDLLVAEERGRWTVRAAVEKRPPFRISAYYRELLAQSRDEEVRSYLTGKLRQAEGILWAVEQRESTLTQCAQVIVDRQAGFFRVGPEGLVPLRMAEVAQALNVHQSTVSRAVREKYLQCARGLYPLKYFFSGPSGGEDTSAAAARRLLRRLIAGEDKGAPLSDGQLCRCMAREGCVLSRRTVAKYRGEMGIPAAPGRGASGEEGGGSWPAPERESSL